GGRAVGQERARTPVEVLGAAGRARGIGQGATQQAPGRRGVLQVDLHAQRAGEQGGGLREVESGIDGGLGEAWGIAQRQGGAHPRLVQARGIARGRRRQQGGAVGDGIVGQVTDGAAGAAFGHAVGGKAGRRRGGARAAAGQCRGQQDEDKDG